MAVDTRAILKEMDADCANALQNLDSELGNLRHVRRRARPARPSLTLSRVRTSECHFTPPPLWPAQMRVWGRTASSLAK